MKYKKTVVVFLIALAIALGLYGFYIWYKKPIAPTQNPHPKYYVTISGNISPTLKKPFYMGFWVTYAGYHSNCSTTMGGLSGVEAMHAKIDFYSAEPDKQGDYKVKIPIDAYKPGACGWKISSIDYTWEGQPIFAKNQYAMQGVMSFGDQNSENELPSMPVIANCTAYMDKKGLRDTAGCMLGGGYEKLVPRNKNYNFTQNVQSMEN